MTRKIKHQCDSWYDVQEVKALSIKILTSFPSLKKSTESNQVPRSISLQETQGVKEQVKQHKEVPSQS